MTRSTAREKLGLVRVHFGSHLFTYSVKQNLTDIVWQVSTNIDICTPHTIPGWVLSFETLLKNERTFGKCILLESNIYFITPSYSDIILNTLWWGFDIHLQFFFMKGLWGSEANSVSLLLALSWAAFPPLYVPLDRGGPFSFQSP